MERKSDDLDRTREPEVPQELARDLARLYGKDVPVPPEAEARILARAGSRFAGQKHRRQAAWWLGAAASAAAAVVVACVLFQTLGGPHGDPHRSEVASSEFPVPEHEGARKEDFDRNGTVNIVDAMLLARRIESSVRPEPSWDINGDGVVDRADVDAIGRAAVSLQGG